MVPAESWCWVVLWTLQTTNRSGVLNRLLAFVRQLHRYNRRSECIALTIIDEATWWRSKLINPIVRSMIRIRYYRCFHLEQNSMCQAIEAELRSWLIQPSAQHCRRSTKPRSFRRWRAERGSLYWVIHQPVFAERVHLDLSWLKTIKIC